MIRKKRTLSSDVKRSETIRASGHDEVYTLCERNLWDNLIIASRSFALIGERSLDVTWMMFGRLGIYLQKVLAFHFALAKDAFSPSETDHFVSPQSSHN